jgi:4-alpha-glucanotransferase
LSKVRFVFCLHNHQPVGNLPEVFEEAYRNAYLPMLETIERFPSVKVVLHNSGPLLEWYEEHAPDYIDRVRSLVERGQMEVLGGAFYEPILVCIPERDIHGQISMMSQYVADRFGKSPRGMWLAERVWEPGLAGSIGRAGIEYLPVDDYEFRLAGLADADLVGSFVTDDRGSGLSLFPISKKLRYAIPFAQPEETLNLLKGLAERGPDMVAVFGDDGEKFGIWPGTYKHVYEGGWLTRFFTAIAENSDWIETATMSEVIDAIPPRGRAYLPTSSYPEMMEWALPTPARRSYAAFKEQLKRDGLEESLGPFVSGGTWRGFLSKYEESNLMARKMLRVSDRIARSSRASESMAADERTTEYAKSENGRPSSFDSDAITNARRELWRGQCNCAYWHGVFGGLYLPHLRSAVYEHLIRAERLLESGGADTWNYVDVVDHDMDGHKEVLLESDSANVYVAPWRGGAIFEFDVKRADCNVLATMSRYDEAYYQEIPGGHADDGSGNGGGDTGSSQNAPGSSTDSGHSGGVEHGDEVRSIHGNLTVKEQGLIRLAKADGHPRWAAVDHFLDPDRGRQLAGWRNSGWSDIERGNAAWAPYTFKDLGREKSAGVAMTRSAAVRAGDAEQHVQIEKSVWLEEGGALRVEYRLLPDEDVDLLFGSEWNLAFLTGAPEWTSMGRCEEEVLDVRELHDLADVSQICISDRLRNQKLTMSLGPQACVWTRPLETASQSEGGLERVFQGLTLIVLWELRDGAGKSAEFSVTIASSPLS